MVHALFQEGAGQPVVQRAGDRMPRGMRHQAADILQEDIRHNYLLTIDDPTSRCCTVWRVSIYAWSALGHR